MSAPAAGLVHNPQSHSKQRYPYLQISNRPGSVFSKLMADPKYRAILFRDNAKALAAAGYSKEEQLVRDEMSKHPHPVLNLQQKIINSIPVRHKSSRTSRGWHAVAQTIQRGRLPPHCLLDAAHNKYPVCDQDGTFDCRGIRAAKQRAHINAKRGIVGAKSIEATAHQLVESLCTPARPTRRSVSLRKVKSLKLQPFKKATAHSRRKTPKSYLKSKRKSRTSKTRSKKR